MLPRVTKEFMAWIGSNLQPLYQDRTRTRFSWRPFYRGRARIRFNLQWLFQGRALLLTNTLSGGVLMALGDMVQQARANLSEPGKTQDWSRTGRQFIIGCSMVPPLQFWYVWLDKVLVGNCLKTLGKKVLADQLVNTPSYGTMYFVGMGLMEGQTLYEAWTKFTEKFVEFYKADCSFWIPAQTINFYFFPTRYRIMYTNVLTVGWDIYLSYLHYRDDSHPTELGSDSSAVDVKQEVLPPSKPLQEKAETSVQTYTA